MELDCFLSEWLNVYLRVFIFYLLFCHENQDVWCLSNNMVFWLYWAGMFWAVLNARIRGSLCC
ncbi:hypothetical protein BC829DRAFT_208359 [Chytridium lagenaria]|nr:hypothetical protein BC829DRAFT_208359 [Chytridium lagenaria]